LIRSFDHVAITVKDLDRTINWYVKNLGFSVKSSAENKERGTRIAFLETNGQAVLEFFGFMDSSKAVDGPTLKAEETGIKCFVDYHLTIRASSLYARSPTRLMLTC